MREVLKACVSFVWLILLPALASAQAEVRVFVGGAMTEPVKAAGAAFARSSGNTLVYSAAITTAAGNGDAARAFLRTLAGAEGRAALTKAGLEPLGPAR